MIHPVLQTVVLVIAVVIMGAGTLAAVMPIVPGPLVVWVGVMLYAVLTGFNEITPLTAIILTILMILGITSDFWLSALGVKATGGSLWGVFGGIAGMVIGLVLLFPIGAMIGAVIGSLLFEYMHSGDVRRSLRSGGVTLGSYLLGIVAEFLTAIVMDAVFLITLMMAHHAG